jgi:hypothetical protein
MKALSHFLQGIAWASCWPGALQSARDNNPVPLLLGATCALLPDTLDHWISRYLQRPDIHIVPPPEAPAPLPIAEALVLAVSQSHETGQSLQLVCYPIPVGPGQWIPYTLQFNRTARHLSVTLAGSRPGHATLSTPASLATDPSATVCVCTRPVVLQTERLAKGRVLITVMPWEQGWTHSLVLALALGALAAGLWGWPAGAIASGAIAWHGFTGQWGFTGSALFWPFTRRRLPGFQWILPRHQSRSDAALLWLAFLLIAGNLLRAAPTGMERPSLLHWLLFGGAIPLALLARFRLNRGELRE